MLSLTTISFEMFIGNEPIKTIGTAHIDLFDFSRTCGAE
jgi:hypothetical protein